LLNAAAIQQYRRNDSVVASIWDESANELLVNLDLRVASQAARRRVLGNPVQLHRSLRRNSLALRPDVPSRSSDSRGRLLTPATSRSAAFADVSFDVDLAA